MQHLKMSDFVMLLNLLKVCIRSSEGFKRADLAGDARLSWVLGPFRHPSLLREGRQKWQSERSWFLAASESSCTSLQNAIVACQRQNIIKKGGNS